MARGRKRPGSRWTRRDWLLAQALEAYEGMLCKSCGHMLTEAMDPALQNEWTTPLPMRCHPCTAIDAMAEKYRESESPHALRFSAQRRRPPVDHGA